MLHVTRPVLPELDQLLPYLKEIWQSGIVTNGGKFHREFEVALAEHLGVSTASAFCNGTIALLTALKALNISGEVITTPFTFLATAHTLAWNGITPVFVDIDPSNFNLDPKRIEEAITESTTAILAVHVYGVPCDVDRISEIAHKHGLKVIYDAAHAFGVECHCGSLLNHGDASILSFHATKVFNTLEGGAVITACPELAAAVNRLRNFGIVSETENNGIGLNGKLNELQAAIGLLNLKSINHSILLREKIDRRLREVLKDVPFLSEARRTFAAKDNYAYFPVLLEKDCGIDRDLVINHLSENDIRARRYFYPLVSDSPPYNTMLGARHDVSVARDISERVICLPIFPDLDEQQIEQMGSILRQLS